MEDRSSAPRRRLDRRPVSVSDLASDGTRGGAPSAGLMTAPNFPAGGEVLVVSGGTARLRGRTSRAHACRACETSVRSFPKRLGFAFASSVRRSRPRRPRARSTRPSLEVFERARADKCSRRAPSSARVPRPSPPRPARIARPRPSSRPLALRSPPFASSEPPRASPVHANERASTVTAGGESFLAPMRALLRARARA